MPHLCYPPCPPAISIYYLGQWGKRAGLGSSLVSKRRNVRERKVWDKGRKWEESIATPVPRGILCSAVRLHQLQSPRCISAASAGGVVRAHSSSHKQGARALPLLAHTLLTFLRLTLPLYHWIQMGLGLWLGLPMFPGKQLSTTEARDIKKASEDKAKALENEGR